MSGRKLAYGEETALSRRIRATMPEQVIYYDPELYVYHLVHSKNMSLHWIIRQRFATGRYSYRVFQGNNSIARARHDGLERQSLKKVLLKLLRDVRWDRARQPHFQNYLYEDVFGYLHSLGVLYERFLNVMCRTKCSIDEKR
jgi:hypothetical protein